MRAFLIIAMVAGLFPISAPAQGVPASRGEIALSFSPVVKKATPSVVNIYARKLVARQSNPFASDPFFDDFFRNFGNPAPQVQNSLGSGVILSSDGLVVSNFHVVGGAVEIRVVLTDRREFDARVVLADKQADLAVLRLEGARDLPAMPLRNSREVEVGDLVLAIGNPFGVGQTVSSGIISGLARSGGVTGNARSYFIQTDAPINPGNSGGALVDMSGALVGINTSILTRSGGSNGIGFAIPADLVAQFLTQARKGNTRFIRPWAGMVGQLVDGTLAEGLGLSRAAGMVIVSLNDQSPFARAGLKVGDVITAFDGQPVNGPAEMLYHMSVAGIGASAKVTYLRNGREKTLRVAMIAPPDSPARNTTEIRAPGPMRGLTLARINPAVISETDLPVDAKGVVVLKAEGVAARAGFKPGDILREVNGQRITTVKAARRAARAGGAFWEVVIERQGQLISMRFQI